MISIYKSMEEEVGLECAKNMKEDIESRNMRVSGLRINSK
jgi:hypothetical protein